MNYTVSPESRSCHREKTKLCLLQLGKGDAIFIYLYKYIKEL